jgi:hypothetical protein
MLLRDAFTRCFYEMLDGGNPTSVTLLPISITYQLSNPGAADSAVNPNYHPEKYCSQWCLARLLQSR